MQFIVAVLEVFLPELMSVMSGPSSIPLANRFKRVGYGLIGLSFSYFVFRLVWVRFFQDEVSLVEGLLGQDLPILMALIVVGGVALSLSRQASMPVTGVGRDPTLAAASSRDVVSSEDIEALDEWVAEVAAGYELRLSRSFSPASPSHYRRESRVSWLKLASALKGRVPLETWKIEVEGISLTFSFFAGSECFRVREQDGLDEVCGTIIPGERAAMRVRLVDQSGSVRELDLIPQPSLRYQLLVFVDAVPIALRR